MAAAWVDDALRAYLEAYLSRDKALAKALFRSEAPLGTFGVRIKLAYLLGLISSDLRSELDLIRDIRNDFAHVRTRVSFRTDSVVSRCNELRTAAVFEDYSVHPLTSQEKFVISAYFLAEMFITLSDRTKPPEPAPEFFFGYVRSVAKSAGVQQLLKIIQSEASTTAG